MFVFNKICWIMFPLKSGYCGKNFHVNLSCFECLGAIQSSKSRHFWIIVNFGGLFLLHTMSFSNKFFFRKVAHTSLVCVAKFFNQSKELWVIEKHFSKRSLSQNCVFCNYFLTFQIHFANSMRQLNDIFFHLSMCLYQVLKHFRVWSSFIWLGLEI